MSAVLQLHAPDCGCAEGRRLEAARRWQVRVAAMLMREVEAVRQANELTDALTEERLVREGADAESLRRGDALREIRRLLTSYDYVSLGAKTAAVACIDEVLR